MRRMYAAGSSRCHMRVNLLNYKPILSQTINTNIRNDLLVPCNEASFVDEKIVCLHTTNTYPVIEVCMVMLIIELWKEQTTTQIEYSIKVA